MRRSKKITLQIVSGFIYEGKGGNPAGLVLNADDLSNEEKQLIAAKAGLSETAFVSASSVAEFKFDFFTPSKQIPHCGHATIAAFSYLKQKGVLQSDLLSKETIDGTRKIIIKGENAFMEQIKPVYTSVAHEMNDILLSMGLSTDILINDAAPCIINTGNSFLIIGIKDQEILKNIHYDRDLVYAICQKYNLVGFYPFCRDTVIAGRDATTRMFGPYYGIPEESATGMAAGPLACYLHDKIKLKKQQFLIEQGYFMTTPSPSLIIVDLNIQDGQVTSLMAGGKGMAVRTIEIEI